MAKKKISVKGKTKPPVNVRNGILTKMSHDYIRSTGGRMIAHDRDNDILTRKKSKNKLRSGKRKKK